MHDRPPRAGARASRLRQPRPTPRDRGEIAERRHDARARSATESVFAVGNGYLGIRGTPEEGGPAHDAGAILNGFHETWPIVYPEDAYGLARTGQTIVNATDGIDHPPVRRRRAVRPRDRAGPALRARRSTCATGVLSREVEFETPRGRRAARALAPARVARGPPPRRLRLRGRRARRRRPHRHLLRARHPRPRRGAATTRAAARASPRRCSMPIAAHARRGTARLLHLATRSSGLELACGMDHDFEARVRRSRSQRAPSGDGAQVVVLADARRRRAAAPAKYVAYHWAAEAAAGELLVARRPHARPRAPRTATSASSTPSAARVADFWRAQRRAARRRARRSSRPCASTSSSCCRRPRAARASACRPRA